MHAPPEDLSGNAVSLFLDVDGTLLEIEDHPQAVTADHGLIDSLLRIAEALDGALALVSGRSIAEIDRLFRPAVFPAAGAHGVQLRLSATDAPAAAGPALPATAMHALQAFSDRHEGLLLERKPAGASLHYRRAPLLAAEAGRIVEGVMHELGPDYRLIRGKMVFEIAPRGHSKGEAIRAFMRRVPFRGRRPVFVGDDVTDEDGFAAANDCGGVSIRVGQPGDTQAQYVLASVGDVRRWIEDTFIPSGT